jgi:hypothetical protein
MPITFPSSPLLNDTYTFQGRSWRYDGSRWTPSLNVLVAGTSSVSIPVGTTAQRPVTPNEGDFRMNSDTDNLEIYYNTKWNNVRYLGYAFATGGDVTVVGDYRIHTFTSSGYFNVLEAPLGYDFDYFIVGGGGGGGSDMGGGGGGAEVKTGTTTDMEVAQYTITVGAGGLGSTTSATAPGALGEISEIVGTGVNLSATYGGGGASKHDTTSAATRATTGASGGGASGSQTNWAAGTLGLGNDGGASGGQWRPGGGGGAGGPGVSGVSTNPSPADGGPGIANSFLGIEYYWAAGGAGGGYTIEGGNGGLGGGGGGAPRTTTRGLGGTGGINPGGIAQVGTLGAQTNVRGGNTGPNTGSGGGGGSHNTGGFGGNGGSGIVAIKYRFR